MSHITMNNEFKLVFASQNIGKYDEVKKMMPKKISLLSLNDINFSGNIEETGKTLKQNAKIKSDFIFKNYKINCFADDTGLEVEVLNGEPGVLSARYAGNQHIAIENIEKLLRKLKNHDNRKAQFRTVIALIYNRKEYFFEGIIKGKIIREAKGNYGFGYDPIFQPENHFLSFAQLGKEEKNKISHRGLAMDNLLDACF